MTTGAEKIFYGFSMVVALAAMFVMTPVANTEVASFQSEVKNEIGIAWVQTFGDQPVFDEVRFVIESVNEFYVQSADAMIALLEPTVAEEDMNNMLAALATEFKVAYVGLVTNTWNEPKVASSNVEEVSAPVLINENFMLEKPVANILPDEVLATWEALESMSRPVELAKSEDNKLAVAASTWVNLKDGMTGQIYCVGIFNASVNQYLGPCKNDYY